MVALLPKGNREQWFVHMTVTSLIRAVIFPDSGTPAPLAATLKPGDLLAGRILEITDNGKVVIDFGNLRLLADTELVFQPGEKIRVRVEETGEQIKLKHLVPSQPETGAGRTVPDSPDRLLTRLFDQLPASIDRALQTDERAAAARLPDEIRQALMSVRALLQPSVGTLRPAEIAMLLKHLVDNSGIFFEKRMENVLALQGRPDQGRSVPPEEGTSGIRQLLDRDLKPNLMILRDFLHDPAGLRYPARAELEGLKPAVDQMLTTIQRHQHHAGTFSSDADTAPAFSLFFNLKKTRQRGLLKVYTGSRAKNKKGDGARISLLLRMDRIGDIQTDLLLVDRSLQVNFRVADETVKHHLEMEAGPLVDELKRLFSSVQMDVHFEQQLRQEIDTLTMEMLSDRHIDVHA